METQARFPRMATLGRTLGLLGRFQSDSAWARRRSEPGIADFTFGNPHDLPMERYVDALQRHAVPEDKDWFAYKFSEPASQRVVADSLRAFTGIPFEPEDIALTNGGFGALAAAIKATTVPGDEVVYSLPPWFLYEMLIVDNGLVPVKVRVGPETFDLDLDAIERAITPRTPHPHRQHAPEPDRPHLSARDAGATGGAIGRRLAAQRAAIYLLSDEPYNRIVFDGVRFHSPAEFYPHTLVAYSYGKVLLAPGQRIGYLAMPPGIEGRAELRTAVFLAQGAGGYLFPNALLQHALPDLERLSIDIPRLQRKRDRMVAALRDMGYRVHVPEGTFYLLPRSPLADDVVFAELLAEHDVFVLPGTICEMPGYFRVSLTANEQMIERALPASRPPWHGRGRGTGDTVGDPPAAPLTS